MIAACYGLYFGLLAVRDSRCWGNAGGFHLQTSNRRSLGSLLEHFHDDVHGVLYCSVQKDLSFQNCREYVSFSTVKSDPEAVLGVVGMARSEAAFLAEPCFHYCGSSFAFVGTSFVVLVHDLLVNL